jgi:hypothetical protein
METQKAFSAISLLRQYSNPPRFTETEAHRTTDIPAVIQSLNTLTSSLLKTGEKRGGFPDHLVQYADADFLAGLLTLGNFKPHFESWFVVRPPAQAAALGPPPRPFQFNIRSTQDAPRRPIPMDHNVCVDVLVLLKAIITSNESLVKEHFTSLGAYQTITNLVKSEQPSDTLQLGFCQLVADLVEINQHKRLREAGVIDALVSMAKVIKSLPRSLVVFALCVPCALCFVRCTARVAFYVLRFEF